ncbi:hypothetical protein AB0E88_34200 [Streptomyces sp. NPDC028635]|uniref:hypothetical protein n=1 Tax=Streptomyces sp. NPDC028635 TaxID=3154800 RepID=UPI0033F0C32C
MPFPPPRLPSGPRRRTLLVASATGALLVAGCSGGSEDAGGTSTPSPTERTRARAARDSAGLLARYDAVLAAHPPLAARIGPLRAEVARHVEAFGGTAHAGTEGPAGASRASGSPSGVPSVSGSASGAPSASGGPSVSASVSPVVPVPGTEKEALAQLAGAERVLADRRASELAGVDGELARLLASVAAAGAAHAFLLTEGAA